MESVRRHYLASIFYVLPVILLVGCIPNRLFGPSDGNPDTGEISEDALTELVACGSSLGLGSWPMVYAEQTGLFQEYGLQVDIHYMHSGSSAMTALLAGDADLCHIAGSSVVNAALAVEDPVIIAGLINRQPYSLVVAPDIKQLDDLRGKVLAVSSPGSASDTVLRKGLAAYGLDPDTDVAFVSVGRQAERLAALESGQVAGSLFTLTELDNATSAGFAVLLDQDDLDIPYQHTSIVTTRSFLANNQETVVNFLKAVVAARAAMILDPDNGPDVIANGLLLDSEQGRNNIRNIYSTVVEDYLDQFPYPNQDGLNELLEQGRRENPTARDIVVDDMIDVTIIQELQESGFIDALYDQE